MKNKIYQTNNKMEELTGYFKGYVNVKSNIEIIEFNNSEVIKFKGEFQLTKLEIRGFDFNENKKDFIFYLGKYNKTLFEGDTILIEGVFFKENTLKHIDEEYYVTRCYAEMSELCNGVIDQLHIYNN